MEGNFHPFVLVENTPIIPAAEGGVPAHPAAEAAHPTIRYVGVGVGRGGYMVGWVYDWALFP